ncbi:MAG: Fic family protein [Pseudomonadales bacterium]
MKQTAHFTPFIIRYTNNRQFANTRKFSELHFHLNWIHIFATGNKHVFLAVGNRVIAFGIAS